MCPKLVFLCESRQNKNKVCHHRHRLDLNAFANFSDIGQSGGLALFWHDSLDADIKDLMKYISNQLRLTCIYGKPRDQNRHLMWVTLHNLKEMSNLPWVIM